MADEKKKRPKTAIIVGAGVGGVATAARLAKAGFQVSVYEKNAFTGGRCSLIRHEGYRFDQGPSLLLLPALFHATFADLATSLADEDIHLHRCSPNYNLFFADGGTFQLSSDLATMKREIERHEGAAGFERYLAFLQEAHRHYEISVAEVLSKNFAGYTSLLRWSFLRRALTLHPFESIYARASRYFRTERLRRVFTFASMYMGMSPFDAPGTYSLLQYTELAEGIWYPRGGFHAIVAALVRVGERLGARYHLATPVARVVVDAATGRATGVVLESGAHVDADVVVVNADLVYAYRHLLPPSALATRLSKREASCSSISFYWALDRQVPQLATHNIFLADAYRASFDDIFRRHAIPAEPSFYLNVPSRADPSAAPAGRDAVVVLVPVGHMLEEGEPPGDGGEMGGESESGGGSERARKSPRQVQDWPAMVASARATVVATIEARTGARGLAAAIVHEEVNTPPSWKETFNLDKGAILGLSHSFFNVLAFRPRTKHPKYEGLFFVGASTHPGTGVPIVLAGAKLVSEQILAEEGCEIPWRGGEQKREVGEIDRVQGGGPPWANGRWGLVLVLVTVLGLVWLYAMGFAGWEGVGEEVWT